VVNNSLAALLTVVAKITNIAAIATITFLQTEVKKLCHGQMLNFDCNISCSLSSSF
jgi:hypothetical protein